MFDFLGEIRFAAEVDGVVLAPDAVFEAALEAGAQDVVSSDDGHEVFCDPGDLHAVSAQLVESLAAPESVKLVWKPQNNIAVDEDAAGTLLRLLDALDESDDVQTISANFEIADDILERLTA